MTASGDVIVIGRETFASKSPYVQKFRHLVREAMVNQEIDIKFLKKAMAIFGASSYILGNLDAATLEYALGSIVKENRKFTELATTYSNSRLDPSQANLQERENTSSCMAHGAISSRVHFRRICEFGILSNHQGIIKKLANLRIEESEEAKYKFASFLESEGFLPYELTELIQSLAHEQSDLSLGDSPVLELSSTSDILAEIIVERIRKLMSESI